MSSPGLPRIEEAGRNGGRDAVGRPASHYHGSSRSETRNLLFEALLISMVLMGGAFLVNAHQGLSWADEGLLWYGSQRVYAGEIPVRDFFSYDPGRYYWTAAFYSLLSNTSLRTTLIAGSAFASLALCLTLFTFAKAGVNRPWRWLLAVAICIAFTFPRHKIYEQSLSLVLACAIYFVLVSGASAKRWCLLGLVTGLAAVMGRNHGVFFLTGSTLTIGFLFLTQRKVLRATSFVSYSGGVVIGYAPIWLLCIFNTSFLHSFWSSLLKTAGWQIPLQIPFFWNIDLTSVSAPMKWHAIGVGLVCLLIPATYFFSAMWVGGRYLIGLANRRHLLLASFSFAGIPYLHQAFDRADFGHIAQGVLPGLGALVCVCVLASSGERCVRVIQWLGMSLLLITVATWAPYVPSARLSLLEAERPGSTSEFSMDGTIYRVERYQAILLRRVKQLQLACDLSDGQFLAAPHFPGLYAFLNIAAPHWDSYYVYNRSPDLQRQHLAAMSDIKLALIAPDATIDGLKRLKFSNIYGESLRYIEGNLERSPVEGFPYPLYIYVRSSSCTP